MINSITKLLSSWPQSLAAATTLLVSAAAAAQPIAPPQPGLTKTPLPWVGYVIMVLLVTVVLGVSLLPSKRGHQD